MLWQQDGGDRTTPSLGRARAEETSMIAAPYALPSTVVEKL
jgi:hypothetical protein